MAVGPDPALRFQGYLDSVLTVIMMACVVVILVARAPVGGGRQTHAGCHGTVSRPVMRGWAGWCRT